MLKDGVKDCRYRRFMAFAAIALFAGVSVAGVKYVAVVETEIDAQSGAAAELTPAEVRLITAELRREAVKNLPPPAYSIMTTETVIAQGSATLEQCFDENCVIALGTKIGADYIVRGTISKFRARYTLTVEMYETSDGNLVASSEPVRSENAAELLEKAAAAGAEMYREFAKAQRFAAQSPAAQSAPPAPAPPAPAMPAPAPPPAPPKQPANFTVTAAANPPNGGTVSRNPNQASYAPGTKVNVMATPAKNYMFAGWSGDASGNASLVTVTADGDKALTANFSRKPALERKPASESKPAKTVSLLKKSINGISGGGGIFYAGDFGGGLRWDNGEILSMGSHMGGAYLFLDAAYAAVSISYAQGGGMWETPNNADPNNLPYMHRSSLYIGGTAKYPNLINAAVFIAGTERKVSVYPIFGFDYEFPVSGKLEFADKPEYVFDGGNMDGYTADALSALWVKFGAGLDHYLTRNIYVRAEMLYGVRMSNWFELDQMEKAAPQAERPRLGHGLTLKAGAGIKLKRGFKRIAWEDIL
jgi:uncharacterized repeat protein (TIGR02543 family)